MRVFVGIPLSLELQEQAVAWQNQHAILPVRWIAPRNLHITVVPPWDEADPGGALKDLGGLTGADSSFSVEFTGVSFGPRPRDPRLIWAFGEPPVEALELVAAAYRALALPDPNHDFILHATLARFRPEDFRRFPVRELLEAVEWRMDVTKLALYESRLLPGGADYRVIGEVSL
jgi:2'-5' RNA ligase